MKMKIGFATAAKEKKKKRGLERAGGVGGGSVMLLRGHTLTYAACKMQIQ